MASHSRQTEVLDLDLSNYDWDTATRVIAFGLRFCLVINVVQVRRLWLVLRVYRFYQNLLGHDVEILHGFGFGC
jgi:hypothetical protein